MKILIACEESQRVCIEFRRKGHEAYSCDIIDCSSGHPEWHIKQDVIPLLNGNCTFKTVDGTEHSISGKWDMIIAFPPCTYLCVAGNSWFNIEKYGEKAKQRYVDRYKAIVFFMRFVSADCKQIIIENPIGIMSTAFRKPDQIIEPYEFGDPYEKKTCLWLKGVPLLRPENIVKPVKKKTFSSGKTMPSWYAELWSLKKEERSKQRSKTFPGIARAMADQWG